MDPNPPQGKTDFSWAAAVVCAAHDLGVDVTTWRSATGLTRLVAARFGKEIPKSNEREGLGGINRVVALARYLGLEAEVKNGQTEATVRGLIASGARPVVFWNPANIQKKWGEGPRAGVVLAWREQVSVSDSRGDEDGHAAALRVFVAPPKAWFTPTIAVLRKGKG